MSKSELTKIFHDHLEFKFYYKEHKIVMVDHLYEREYELIPTGDHDLPIQVILIKQ